MWGLLSPKYSQYFLLRKFSMKWQSSLATTDKFVEPFPWASEQSDFIKKVLRSKRLGDSCICCRSCWLIYTLTAFPTPAHYAVLRQLNIGQDILCKLSSQCITCRTTGNKTPHDTIRKKSGNLNQTIEDYLKYNHS